MTAATQGILTHTLCSFISAIGFHWVSRRYLLASIEAAIVANLAFHAIIYVVEGSLDKFFLVAIIVGFWISLGISLAVGLPFLLSRRNQNQHRSVSM